MQLETYTTEDGWPGVHWLQVVPTGETLFSRRSELQWRFAVLLGLALFGAMLGVGMPLVWAVTAGLAAALVVSSSEILRAIEFAPGGARAGKGRSENERMLEAEAKVVRYGRREQRWAEVARDQGSRNLRFVVLGGELRAQRVLFSVPLLDVAEFELGTDEQWLGDAGSRELREMAQRGSVWVIVAHTSSAGVVEVARSAGDRKEMADLHRALLGAFVAGRAALIARLDEVAGDA